MPPLVTTGISTTRCVLRVRFAARIILEIAENMLLFDYLAPVLMYLLRRDRPQKFLQHIPALILYQFHVLFPEQPLEFLLPLLNTHVDLISIL